MSFALRDDEWARLNLVPVPDLIELAVEMDLLVPADPDGRQLIDLIIPALVTHGLAHGLPFSAYDLDDLAELNREELDAVARMEGLKPGSTAKQVVRAGERVFRDREKTRSGVDPVGYMLPVLLRPVVRHAVERGLHRAGSA